MLFLLSILSLIPVLACSQPYLTFSDVEYVSGNNALLTCIVNDAVGYNITLASITTPLNETKNLEENMITHTFFLQIVQVQYEDRGWYVCSVLLTDSQSMQITITNTAVLTVYVEAAILTHPEGGEFVEALPFAISCRAEGFPTANVTWLKEGLAIPDIISRVSTSVSIPFINSSLEFPSPLQDQSGNYSCQASNMLQDDDSEFNITVTSTPALIQIYPPPMVTSLENRNVTLNSPVTIICNVTGNLPLNFTWKNLSDPTNDLASNSQFTIQHLETASILSIASSSRQFTGYYQCSVSNRFGADTAQMYLLVQEEPSAPSQVSTSVLARSVLISWTLTFDGNSPITEFIIEMEESGSYVQAASVTGVDTRYNVTGLTPFTQYMFRVRARNVIGESAPSSPIQVETAQAEPEAAPRNFTPSGITSNMIRVTWVPPILERWNGLITQFEIEYTLVLTPMEGVSVVDSVLSTLTTPLDSMQENNQFGTIINDLEFYQNYTLRIRACTMVGCGVYSEFVHALTLESTPSAGPSILNVETRADTIRIQWGEIPLRDRNGVIQSYTISYITPDNVNATLRIGHETRDFTIPGLTPYTEHQVSVAGETTMLGPFGPQTQIRTNEAPPSPPVSLQVTYLSSSEFSFNWNTPASPNGIITSYTLYYNQSLPMSETTRSNTTLQPPIVTSDFTVGYPLLVSITANTSAGESMHSEVLTVQPAHPPYIQTTDNLSNITTHTDDVIVFVGDPLTLECVIGAIPDPRFSWIGNFTGSLASLPETVPRYYVPIASPRYTNYYECTGMNLFGSATIMFHVTVAELPMALIQYSIPEFCLGGNGGLNCLEGQGMYITCTYTQGLPKPYVNFTREGMEVTDVTVYLNGEMSDLMSLSNENSGLYICEVSNRVGLDRKEFFINIVGTFEIVTNGGTVNWELSNTGSVEGNYIIEFGDKNISENVASITSSPFNLNEVILTPGMYAWRMKFVNEYGDAAVSPNYPFVAGASAQETVNVYWLIALCVFLTVTIIITLILIIIVCACICKRRRKHAKVQRAGVQGSRVQGSKVQHSRVQGSKVQSSGVQSLEGFSNMATTEFTTNESNHPQAKNSRMHVGSGETFRKKEEYTKNEAYRGPLAFHNQALDSDFDSDQPSKPTNSTFKPSSNLSSNLPFKKPKSSPVEQVGVLGFRRRITPDFPAPPAMDATPHGNSELRDVPNFTPPPPPVPDPTYKK